MTDQQKDEILLDALLKLAVAEAYGSEMDSLPPDEELADYEPTPELNGRVGSAIRKAGRRAAAKRALKNIGKAAACLCILLTVSSIVLLSVQATRNAIFNAVIEWHDEYTQFQFEESSGQPSSQPSGHTGEQSFGKFRRPTYLPDGYTEKSAKIFTISAQFVYENGADGMIILDEQTAEGSTTAIDNERHTCSEIQINGQKAYLFKTTEEDGQNIILWESGGIVYTLIAVMDSEELVKIAESIK